jgi:Spy/CpxP family protein refolding chaperone
MLLFVSAPAFAQDTGHSGHQPYAGLEKREIKALSPQEIEGLKAGRGMSLALAAELNGYPGPMHVLELGDELKLTPEQRSQTEKVMARMREDARVLGTDLIEAERHLDMRFQHRHIDPLSLTAATARIGELQGRLRNAHLVAHLAMVEILTPEQVKAYQAARGYGAGGQGHDPSRHKH